MKRFFALEHVVALLAIAIVHLAVFVTHNDLSAPPYWNGGVYGSSVQQYIDGGYSFDAIDTAKFPRFAMHQYLPSFVQQVMGWIWLVGAMHSAGVELSVVYALLLFFGFLFTGWILYFTTRHGLGAGPVAAVFAGIWFVMLPGTTIIYTVKAHPEPLVALFTAMIAFCVFTRRHLLGGACVFAGMLSKHSAFFAAMVAVGALMSEACAPGRAEARAGLRGGFISALPYAAGAVLAMLVPAVFLADTTPGYLFTKNTLRLIFGQDYGFSYQYILHNFDVLWIPFVLGAASGDTLIRRIGSAVFLLLLVMLSVVSDWWRNPYTSFFPFVLPVAAAFVDRLQVLSGIRVLVVFCGIALALMLVKTPLATSQQPLWWTYVLVCLFFMIIFSNSRSSSGRSGIESSYAGE